MNKADKKLANQIQYGFFLEVSLFVFSGVLLGKKNLWALSFFSMALWVALLVGERIEKHGVNKYLDKKWNLK